MKFRVIRSSQGGMFDPDECPCDGAVQEKYNEYMINKVESRSEIGWFIEIASLDELINFAEKTRCKNREEGIVILFDPPSIEIYDDYRE